MKPITSLSESLLLNTVILLYGPRFSKRALTWSWWWTFPELGTPSRSGPTCLWAAPLSCSSLCLPTARKLSWLAPPAADAFSLSRPRFTFSRHVAVQRNGTGIADNNASLENLASVQRLYFMQVRYGQNRGLSQQELASIARSLVQTGLDVPGSSSNDIDLILGLTLGLICGVGFTIFFFVWWSVLNVLSCCHVLLVAASSPLPPPMVSTSLCGKKERRKKFAAWCGRVRYTMCCGSCREKSRKKAVCGFFCLFSFHDATQPVSIAGAPGGGREEDATGFALALGVPRGRKRPVRTCLVSLFLLQGDPVTHPQRENKQQASAAAAALPGGARACRVLAPALRPKGDCLSFSSQS